MSTTAAATSTIQKRSSATTLRRLRKIHLYFGLFIAPALLFFAFTGAIQTLSLHESAGRSYQPPRILAELGQIHKKQTALMPAPKAPQPATAHNGAGRTDHATAPANHAAEPAKPQQPPLTLASKQKQHLPLKIFFLVVALGLLTSTTTGIYMAYKYERNRLVVTGTLLAGMLVPLVLLKF